MYSSCKTLIAQNRLIKFYCVWPTVFKLNEVHLTILPGATSEFQKSRKKLKNATFLKMRKKSTIIKISIVWCFFKSDRPVCNHLNVNFINTLKTIFSSKSRFLHFLTPKIWNLKKTVKKHS